MIRISQVEFDVLEEQMVLEVLRSGRLAQGPMVERFEREFAEIVGSRHAVAVSSGTAALILPLQAMSMNPTDEVITSPFTFGATLAAILQAGATARFVDINEDDFAIEPSAVESAITGNTKVILPVHLYGQGAAVGALRAIADAKGLELVEDSAQSLGAMVGGKQVGSFGVGCFSFYATKNITTGEGGMVTTDDPALAEKVRVLRNQGMKRKYEYVVLGNNYRMTEIQAALGVAQLQKLKRVIEVRRLNAERLTAGLIDVAGLRLPKVMPSRSHVFHQYTVRVTDEARLNRDSLASELARMGIETGIYYPRAVYDYECFRSHERVVLGEMPVTELLSRQVLSLPVHPGLEEADVQRIIDGIRTLLEKR